MADGHLYRSLDTSVSSVTDFLMNSGLNATVSFVTGIITVCVTVYLLLQSYLVLTGSIQSPLAQLGKIAFKILIISGLALSVEGFKGNVVDTFNGFADGLAQAFVGTGSTVSIPEVVDRALNIGFGLAKFCFAQAMAGSMMSLAGWIVAGLIFGFATLVLVVTGGASIMLTKVALALMYGIGPLFIFALLFPWTARMFSSWFQQVLTFVLILALTTAVLIVGIRLFVQICNDTHIMDSVGDADAAQPVYAAFQVLFVSGIMWWIILQLGKYASSLAGGISIGAVDIMGAVGLGVGAARSAGRAIGGAVNPSSTRRDMASGQLRRNSRFGHMASGNTRMNPAYNSYMREFNRSQPRIWGSAAAGASRYAAQKASQQG